ncbi:MAG: hypothetical protein BMS9Abin18_0585 [Zetaproteobacteria bacterium]|nr:MAG: hypothetical protein BMS9Abin18_0585 [Zetaproteobacteria bacterium]
MIGRTSTSGKSACMMVAGLLLLAMPRNAMAHDPVFGLGPHTIYEGGVEITPEFDVSQSASTRGQDLTFLKAAYGINADWTAGIELPWTFKENVSDQANGLGDLRLFTKYRFWRKDSPGVQESVAALLKVKFDTSKQGANPAPTVAKPALGTGTADVVLGLTYGYESLKWYRWASIRYRRNGHSSGKKVGDKVLVDLVAGWRPTMPEYLKPDMVWLLELNGEYGRRGSLDNVSLVNDGGTELFLSPGFMWTVRNFAVKAGVQLPVFSNLNGVQTKTDYRAKLELEWHL